jgi:hypothetical protein
MSKLAKNAHVVLGAYLSGRFTDKEVAKVLDEIVMRQRMKEAVGEAFDEDDVTEFVNRAQIAIDAIGVDD